ncbi:MAG: MBOAT family protein [Proteobacteria bacterium]|jgi:alginate O-acetyltransferase complex protein AlgI|nr:MBOAT family protein [Pseudomonadota bacterium]
MVFSSQIFLFYFLPLTLAVYYGLPRRGRHLALTLLSYGFYGWANPLFVVMLLTSTLISYVCGLKIAGERLIAGSALSGNPELDGVSLHRKKVWLSVSVVTSLSMLGFFKYFNFAVDNYDFLIHGLGLSGLKLETVLRVTLPLGISFYTFQLLSYTIDVYRGQAKSLRNFIDFACYISLFTQLVAGPIIRFREIADQMTNRTHTVEKFSRGVAFVSLGLAKKVLLANPCGKIADVVFDAGSRGVLDAWYGLTAYAFQIYFDFSAYSDMAIGLGLMLGFVFPKNFDSPYLSQSITEFWRRWHISLSTWLRDYLYVPLGGNRKGVWRTYFNLAVVMLLGGLWHGASWTFVIWGGIHGGMLVLERVHGKNAFYRRMPRPCRVAMTFFIVLMAWVFFRAADLPSALAYLGSLFGLTTVQDGAGLLGGILYQPYYWGTFSLAALIVWGCPQTWDWTRTIPQWKVVPIALALLISIVVLMTQSYNPFIYFIF